MRYLVLLGSILLFAACDRAVTAPVTELACAENSVNPLAFRQYDRAAKDSFIVANRVTVPHRYNDTLIVLDGQYRVVLVKNGGRCQTLYDSLLARHNPPIVAELP